MTSEMDDYYYDDGDDTFDNSGKCKLSTTPLVFSTWHVVLFKM